jgi:oligopeptide/dipeptide ABC transporter ATP-binding protein
MEPAAQRLLEVQNLEVFFESPHGPVHAVKGVSFHIDKGEIVALVGESGSGKSVTALSLTKLHRRNVRYGEESRILFRGRDLLRLSEEEIRHYRGKELSMIFQDPMSSLNPVQRVGRQVMEMLLMTGRANGKKEAARMAVELLRKVGIPDPDRRIRDYPHQLSGGMRQRVMIAIALASNPSLLIADEPTTALDVTIQAQILDLLKKLQRETGTSILLITHDLGIVAEMADRVIVMYNGDIVEASDVRSLFKRPLHPYTRGLIQSVPHLAKEESKRLVPIAGTVPGPLERIDGCRFHPRCPLASDRCRNMRPMLQAMEAGREAACWHPLTEHHLQTVG